MRKINTFEYVKFFAAELHETLVKFSIHRVERRGKY